MDIKLKLTYAQMAETVESRLADIVENTEIGQIDDDGWWILGNCYLFLYNLKFNNTLITDELEKMNQLLQQAAGSAAIAYRELSDHYEELDDEEAGLFALLFGFLSLYKEYSEQKAVVH